MAPVAVAPPPLRFSFQPLAGHKVRRGCGAQSPARKKRRIGCGAQSPARKKARIDKGALRPVSKKARPELQGSLLHARGLAAQTQPLARPRAAARQGFCLRNDVQQHRKVYEAWALHNGVSWLSGRERRSGRQRWGLGCTLCAQYWAAGRKQRLPYAHSDRRFSKFAKFECSPRREGWPSG